MDFIDAILNIVSGFEIGKGKIDDEFFTDGPSIVI